MKKTAAKNTTKGKGQKILHVSADKLSIHPLLAGLPVMDEVVKRLAKDAKDAKGGQYADKQELLEEGSMSWAGFVADIKERGIIEPLVVVAGDTAGTFVIIDGRHRFAAGKEAERKLFPIRVTTDDPSAYIMGAVCHRYHWSKSQRAFFALHLHPYLVAGVQGARTDKELSDPIGKFPSREALAASIGVSADTVDLAAKVHDLFSKDPAARKKYLPLIFAGISLAGVLRGDGATKTDDDGSGGKRLAAWQRMREKFVRDSKLLKKDWEDVAKASPAHQAEVKEAFTALLLNLPDALAEHARDFFTGE